MIKMAIRDKSKQEEVMPIMLAMLDEAEQNCAKKFAIQMLQAGKISEEELEEYFPMLSKEEVDELLNEVGQKV